MRNHAKRLAVFLALVFSAAAGNSEPCGGCMPPVLEPDSKLGCRVLEVHNADGGHWWHVYVHVKDKAESEWRRLYAVRYGDERSAALHDCEAWLRCVEKEVRKNKKQKGRLKP